jgi:hypothetical protein
MCREPDVTAILHVPLALTLQSAVSGGKHSAGQLYQKSRRGRKGPKIVSFALSFDITIGCLSDHHCRELRIGQRGVLIAPNHDRTPIGFLGDFRVKFGSGRHSTRTSRDNCVWELSIECLVDLLYTSETWDLSPSSFQLKS